MADSKTVKLTIKTASGRVLAVVKDKNDFDQFRPLIMDLEVDDLGKKFVDTRMLRLTNKFKLVAN